MPRGLTASTLGRKGVAVAVDVDTAWEEDVDSGAEFDTARADLAAGRLMVGFGSPGLLVGLGSMGGGVDVASEARAACTSGVTVLFEAGFSLET